MTSFGSTTLGAQRRSGFVVLTFLLALMLGAVTPPSLWSQITIATSLASPQCEGVAFNITASITSQDVPQPSAPAALLWPGGMLGQNAGGVANGPVNNLALGDDGISGEQNPQQTGGADFEFSFYGELLNLTNDGFYVASNGFITFLNGVDAGIIPANVPNVNGPNKTVILGNVDLDPAAGGNIWWQVQEDANGNYLVITYENVPFVNPFQANVVNMQLIIYEDGYAGTPSRIEWRLDDVPNPGAGFYGVFAGFENECGTAGNAVYQNALVNYAAINDEAYTSDPILVGPPYADVDIEYFDGATSMGTAGTFTPGVDPFIPPAFAVPPAFRTPGTHSYSAVVTYTFNGCETSQVTSNTVNFQVVALPVAQVITLGANRCGDATTTAGVPNSNAPNTFHWSSPSPAVTAFVPNNNNAAQNTTIFFNNALLAQGGTSVTINMEEQTSVPIVCASNPDATITSTFYRTPGVETPAGITGPGVNTAVNQPGNPCAGTTAIYTQAGASGVGATAPATLYRWVLTGAPVGTTMNGNPVSGGTVTVTTQHPTNTVSIAWPASTSHYSASLTVQPSNGTGGAAGVPGSNRSCAGPTSVVHTLQVNGVPAAATVVQTPAGTVCEQDNRTYSIAATPGSSYTWSITPGTAGVNWNATIPAPPNNHTITIDWLLPGTYSVSVTETTSGGCVRVHNPLNNIVVNPLPNPTWLLNPSQGCTYIGGTLESGRALYEYTYRILGVSGRSYNFTVLNGIFTNTNTSNWLVNGAGANLDAIVRWSLPGANWVSVTETIIATGCAVTITQNVTVTESPTPKTISGPGYVTPIAGNPCAGTGPHTYQISGPWPNGNNWSVSVLSGGVVSVALNLANGQFGVTYNAGVTSARIRITETNPAAPGCVTEREFNITVNPQPTGTVSVVPTAVCNGDGGVATFNPGVGTVLPGATYLWSTTTPLNIALTPPLNLPSVAFTATNPGPGVASGNLTITVTNPGVGGCAVAFTQSVNIVPDPTVLAPTVPVPICVGGTYAITGNASAYPGGGVTRNWNFQLTPVGAYSGAAPLSTSFNLNAAAAVWNVTIGDSSLADILAGGSFNLTITVTDNLSPASCATVGNFGPFTVETRPVRPLLDFPNPQVVCDGAYPQVYNITNYLPGLYSYSLATSAAVSAFVAPTFTVNDWGAPGAHTVDLTATDLITGCTRVQHYDITVVAQPVNPQPAPVITNATQDELCVDSLYFDNPSVVGPLAIDPTRIITYSAPVPLANHWYQWYVTNGFIITGTPGSYVSVGQFTTAALNATSCQVVWTGPTPGKVKYLVFTSDPNNPPPAACFATSIEPTLNLPLIPTVPLTFTTSSSAPGNKICEGETVDLILSSSEIGLDYRVEEWNGTSWVNTGVTPVAGTGAALNITVPASVLTITTSPITDHVFRITAKDQTFTPDISGPCEWLRTATDVITIQVYDTPNDIPVTITTTLVCEGDNVLVDVGTVGQPAQPHVMYELYRRQIFPVVGAYVGPIVSQMGIAPTITLTDNTTAGIGTGGPLLAVDNYEYEVRAFIPPAPLLPPASGCPATMTAHPTARIFEDPADPTVTFFPNPICWEEMLTVNLANTEAGVEYEVNVNGSFLSPQVILQGTGGAVSAMFNVAQIQPTNPVNFTVVNNVQVEARLVQNATYTRPIPTSACPVNYGTTNITVYEKPVAVVNGPTNSCGPSTATYTADPVTPAPPMYFSWLITTVPPAGTTPTFANPTISGTVNPFVVDWGIHLLNCDGTYNPLAQTIRMIATNSWGCTDTAFYNVTIEPTVADADIQGPTSSCIYGGFEEHLDTFYVERPAPCVFPAGTTYLWTMPSGVVSGAIRSGQFTPGIVAEWYTTGGTNIGTVQCDITLPPSHGGCTTTLLHDVVVYPLPVPVINGPTTVCQGDQNRVYTADNYPSDTYNWQVIGGTIDGGLGAGIVGDTAKRSGVGLNTISIDWLDTPNPNAFIRLRQVSSVGCMNVTTFNVVVNPTPVPVINGADKTCDNSVYTYSTANNAPNNTYLWTVLAGGNATITGGANTATATVLTGDIGGGSSFTLQLTETVLATNCTETVTKVVTIVEKPNPTITRVAPAGGAVGGACLGQTITYGNTDPVAPNPTYNYKWNVSNGAVVGTDEASTVVVTWNTVGTGTVTLNKWHTGSQCTTTVSQDVTITNAPAPTISGPLNVCGESSHTYSTPFIAGNTYAWSISGNGTITGGGTTSAATILFNNPTPGNTLAATIGVTETNTLSGCSASTNISVTIRYQPQVVTITRVSPAGPVNQACNNSTIVYSVPNNTDAIYQWSVTGGTIVSGGTTNQVTVQWTNVGTQTLTLVEKDETETCMATSTLNVGVTYQPVPAITGDAMPCTEDTRVYSTPDVPGSTYLWSLPSAGGTIMSGTTSHQVTVMWTLQGTRTVQVVETNGNCTATATLTVTVGKTPTSTAIARISPTGGVAIACVNQVITYGTSNNVGNTYLWNVTGGNFVGGINNTFQVSIEWTTVGAQTITLKETTAGTTCSKTVTQVVNVEDQPAPTIAGPTPVCTDDMSTYSVTAVAGHTYSWSISGGGTIMSSTTSNSLTVEWTTPGTWTVNVVQTNGTGNCFANASLLVTVGQTPTQTEITGDATVCYGSTETYSVTNVAGQSYTWTVTGGSIVSGAGTSSINVQWTSIGNQTVVVEIGTIGTNCETELFKNVSVEDQPAPSITGPAVVCTDDIATYGVNPVAGHTYAWTISGGGSIMSGVNSHEMTVEWSTGGTHTVTVVQTNGTGNCSALATLSVSVGQTPIQTSIAGDATVCHGSVEAYSVTNIAGQTYVWTVTGGVIVSGAGTSTINVEWTALGTNVVTVEISTNGTNCEKTLTLDVTVEEQPNPSIAGPNVVCTGDIASYSVAAVPGHSYLWSLSGGGSFTSGTVAPTATIQWTTAGTHTVTLKQDNATGNCTKTTTLSVLVNQTPVQTSIAGDATVCNGSVEAYSVTSIPGQSYIWTVTGGTITSGAGTNAITIQWTAMGLQTVEVEIQTIGTNCKVTLTKNVTVEFQPAPSISGDANVCTDTEESYSTPANAGSTYLWTVTGGIITSGVTSNEVTVKWTTAGTQTLTVTEKNASGNCQATATMSVIVSPKPSTTNITRLTPTGPVDQACETDVITYSTPFNATSSYQWTVTGGNIIGSSTSNTVTIKWTSLGNQTLTVVETTTGTDCQTTDVQNVTVTYKPAPNINGANVACINKDHVYFTPFVVGSAYAWSITPTNAFAPIVGYPNSNSIEIKWIQPGLHTVTVTETNIAGGCSTTVSMQVQVNEIPTPFISSTTGYGNPAGRRPGIVCNFSTHTYTTFATPGNTFVWAVTGGTIVSGQYTNTVQVTWGPAGQGTLSVTETIPGSDCITTDRDTFDIRPTPSPNITGNLNPCGNSVETYTTPFVTGNSYTWTVVGGTIISGQGTNTISVSWQNPSWPNTIAGSVSVTEWVTDVLPSMSCINSNTRSITVRPNPPVPTITGPSVVCATDLGDNPQTDNMVTYSTSIPATGSAQGFINYQWTVSSNGSIVGTSTSTSVNVRWTNAGSTPTTGTVTITQTSTWGCVVTASLNVTINPLPNPVVSGPTSVCLNTIHTYSTPGLPGHSYSWVVSGGNIIRSGQGTPNITVEWTVPGTHAVTVTETNTYGCVARNSLNVTVNELPSVTITASGPTTFCQGGDVTLSAPVGFASYVWNTGETSRSIVVHTGGSYFVRVTDENGCVGTSNTIVVNVFPSSLPIITVSGPTTFCEGGSVTLTAPSGFATYLWSTGANTQSIVVTEAGSYTVTVADGNGCTGTSTEVDVFVNSKPTPVLTVVGSTTVCSGDSVEVRAPNGYVSYTWRSERNINYGTGRSIFVKQTDTIYCEVVDANGCVGVSDTVIITVSPVPAPIVIPNGPTTFCDGGSVVLSAPDGYSSYFWSNGATTREITVVDGGSYTVVVTNNASCEAASVPTDVVVNPLPARPSITRSGDTLYANSAVARGYQWYRATGMPGQYAPISGATAHYLLVNTSGTYRVEIQDDNTCSSVSDGYDVTLTDVNDVVFAGHAPELHVFPNPTSGLFNIEAANLEAGDVRIELVNNLGEVVYTINEAFGGGTFKTSVNMGTLANGVYNVVLSTGDQRWSVRLVRQ